MYVYIRKEKKVESNMIQIFNCSQKRKDKGYSRKRLIKEIDYLFFFLRNL